MQLIGFGSSSVVYRIGNVAIKVGDITASEIRRQSFFVRYGLAVPILFYATRMPIKTVIARHLCFVHGYRNDFHKVQSCHCSTPRADILVMPVAERVAETVETVIFSEYLHQLAIRCFGYGRDRRICNLGRYNNTLVGLDWG